jgi:hypothetical protein
MHVETTSLLQRRFDLNFRLLLSAYLRFIFIIFIANGRGKLNLWLKAANDSLSRANQFELGSDPDFVS